jgi:Predicted membrane protein (DUF2306)
MSDTLATPRWDGRGIAQSALKASAVLWFMPAALGQWAFAYHVAKEYFATALAGNLGAWNERLFVGLVAGDLAGNVALVVHLIVAFVVTIGGTLQFVPQIRRAAPAFHRWNGRLYILMAFVTSIAALYMVATRDTFGPDSLEIAVSINAALIMTFAALTLRYAVARQIDVHQRWALRTFMVMSGVWFMRVMYACLAIVTGGNIPGATDDMSGPTNLVVNFASYLLPLAVLELYFLAKRNPNAAMKLTAAAIVALCAVGTGIGAFGTSMAWIVG